MPLYEYRCRKCRRHFEKIQKFSDPPLETCEHCGGRADRLLSAPAIQFKGSGWYVTDYARKPASGETSKSEGAPSKEGEKPSEPAKSTEAKPASSPTKK